MIESNKEYDDLCAMFTECNLVGNQREWLMDSSATCHVCANKYLFSSFSLAQVEEILYLANSATAKVEGIGKNCLKMTFGKVLTLNNVLYLSELCWNLISVSLLDKNGFKCITVSGKIIVSKGEIDISDINVTKRMLESKFDMKDLGVADVILGIRIHRTPQGLALSQSHYIEKVLNKFKYMEFGIAKTLLDVSFALQKNEDYVKSKNNVSDRLTKGPSREGVERTSKGMGLRPRTSQHGGKMTTKSQMMDATMSMGANNIATSSRSNASPMMALAEKPGKFSSIEFKRNYILSGLQDDLYNVYSETKTSKKLWGELERKYKMEDVGIKKFLVARFLNFKMIDSKSVVSQDNKAAERRSKGNSTMNGAHIVEDGQNNSNKRKKDEHGSNQPKKKFKGKCFNCGKIGHKSTDCRAPKKGKKKEQANMIESNKEYDDLCAMFTERNLVGNPRKWLMDSGATRHVLQTKICSRHFLRLKSKKISTRPTPLLLRNISDINVTKRMLESKFDVKDLGVADVILGYSDANWITGSTEVKSTSKYVFTVGGGAVSWKSSKQTCISRSTMESEFIALDKAGEEVEWLRNFLEDISYWPKPVVPAWLTAIYLDLCKAFDLLEMLKKEEEILSAAREKQLQIALLLQHNATVLLYDGEKEFSQLILDERTQKVESWHRNAAARARYTKPAAPITCATFAQDVLEGRAKVSEAHEHKHQPLLFGPASLVGVNPSTERERIAAQVFQPHYRYASSLELQSYNIYSNLRSYMDKQASMN
ncbi:PP2A regulatory subunit TAP46 [Capsicum annuum]|nr:PP2A regulatory subunit TAP46 [Capsicum annuum]